MTTDNTTRAKAVKLMRRGQATHSEVAKLAGVDRQLVAYWAKSAGIDATATRAAWLAKRWANLKHGIPQ